MSNDEEAIEYTKANRRYCEEVQCCDSVDDCSETVHSTLPARASRRIPHRFPYRSLRDVVAEHFQLSMNARFTPSRVLNNHAEDQLSQFPADMLFSNTWPMQRGPLSV